MLSVQTLFLSYTESSFLDPRTLKVKGFLCFTIPLSCFHHIIIYVVQNSPFLDSW